MTIPIANLLSRQKSILLIQKTCKAYLTRKHFLLSYLSQLYIDMESDHPNIPHITSVLNSISHPSPQVQSLVKELRLKVASLEYVYVEVLDSKLVMLDEWELVN